MCDIHWNLEIYAPIGNFRNRAEVLFAKKMRKYGENLFLEWVKLKSFVEKNERLIKFSRSKKIFTRVCQTKSLRTFADLRRYFGAYFYWHNAFPSKAETWNLTYSFSLARSIGFQFCFRCFRTETGDVWRISSITYANVLYITRI